MAQTLKSLINDVKNNINLLDQSLSRLYKESDKGILIDESDLEDMNFSIREMAWHVIFKDTNVA